MTDARDIIESALSRATANDDSLTTDNELVAVIDRQIKKRYSQAARANPNYFGDHTTITPASSKWARPANAIIVTKLEGGGAAGNGTQRVVTAGDEIFVVPHRQQRAERSPKVYLHGSDYFSSGGGGDPVASANGDLIKFYFSKRHHTLNGARATSRAVLTGTIAATASTTWAGTSTMFTTQCSVGDRIDVDGIIYTVVSIASNTSMVVDTSATLVAKTGYNVTNELDASWPEHFNDLLIIPVSRYIAIKDNRAGGEIAALDSELGEVEAVFLEEVQLQAYGQRARYGQNPRVQQTAAHIGNGNQ